MAAAADLSLLKPLKQYEYSLSLGDHIFLEVARYQGRVFIHIRKWSDCETFRTKAGFYLLESTWQEFKNTQPLVTAAILRVQRGDQVNEFIEVAEGIFATIQSGKPYIDVRLFYKADPDPKPTERGLKLSFEQFQTICEYTPHISRVMVKVKAGEPLN